MKKTICLAAAAVILLLLATPAFAAGNTGNAVPGGPCCGDSDTWSQKDSFKYGALKRYDRFFDRLVSDRVISEEQKAGIKSAIEAAAKDARHSGAWKIDMPTILADLVKEGKITAAQKAAVESALKAERLEAIQRRLKAVMDNLVAKGTLTEVQEKAVLSAVADAVNSPDGRLDLGAILDTLVKNGVITQEQQEALKKALKPPHHGKIRFWMKNDKDNKNSSDSAKKAAS
jgi:polyhydroxyalkanoate synthesis regulator phasin